MAILGIACTKYLIAAFITTYKANWIEYNTKEPIEGCPSGLWCDLGRVVWGQLHREFESHPLCIKPRLALLVLGFILGNGFELKQSLALFLSSADLRTDDAQSASPDSENIEFDRTVGS